MKRGLNLHIYPSTLEGATRVTKIATAIQSSEMFNRTEVVGLWNEGLAFREQVSAGVAIVRVKGTARTGNFGRLLKSLLWQPRVYRKYRGENVSAVAAHSVAVLPLAAKIARMTGALLVYNPHELESQTVAMNPLKSWIVLAIERCYLPKVALVSTVGESIAQWYSHKFGIDKPISVTNVSVDDGSHSTVRQRLGLTSDHFLYVHTGRLVGGRNIELIVREFERRPHLHVLFLGDGPLVGRVLSSAAQHPNIHWLPPVASSSVVGEMKGADVGLCLIETNASLSLRFSAPNKLFESLVASTPVLTSDLVEAKRVLGAFSRDWVLSDPVADLGAALDRITKADVARFKQDWSMPFDWESQVALLVEGYRRGLVCVLKQS